MQSGERSLQQERINYVNDRFDTALIRPFEVECLASWYYCSGKMVALNCLRSIDLCKSKSRNPASALAISSAASVRNEVLNLRCVGMCSVSYTHLTLPTSD